jgi:DNA-directed RNA polymerase specialized sigma24 family protein
MFDSYLKSQPLMTKNTQKTDTSDVHQSYECPDDLYCDDQLTSEIKARILAINTLMLQIFLDPKDADTHNIVRIIRSFINKFRLSQYFSEFDVLIETYTIAITQTKQGKVIRNLPSWFKGTAFRIISNLSREEKRQCAIKTVLKTEDVMTADLEIPEDNSVVHPIIQALERLAEDDRYLLNLRVVEGLSWSSIAERMVKDGKAESFSTQLVARLRQRGHRALKQLRDQYQSDF